MPDEADPYGVWDKSDAELESWAIDDVRHFARAGPARAELARRQREHAEALVNKQIEAVNMQLAAAEGVKWATKWAAIAAVASALGTIAQAAIAWWK